MAQSEGETLRDYIRSLGEWWDDSRKTVVEVEGRVARLRRITAGYAQLADLWEQDGERAWNTAIEEHRVIFLGHE